MATVLDYAGGLPSAEAIKRAGHIGVMLYVSPARPGVSHPAKLPPKGYVDGLRAAGLEVVSIWQYGKPGDVRTPSDWTTGRDGGVRMGLEAVQNHFERGGAAYAPIIFAVDEDIQEAQWPAVRGWLRGVNQSVGVEHTGVYGHDEVCAWAIRDGLVGRSGTDGRYWAWQTKAWSEGAIADGIVLYQRVVDTLSSPGPLVDGVRVDVNDVYAPDFGQWSIDRSPGGNKPVGTPPPLLEEDQTDNSPNSSGRYGAVVVLNVKHTQEGAGTAQSLTNFLKNPASEVSYHYACDNERCIAVVDTDRASWSVLDANSRTVNFCYAGSRVSMSRQEWLDDFGRAIDMDAWLCVRDGRKYGVDPRALDWDEIAAGQKGCTDHFGITKGLKIGSHTDVGPNYPWDVFVDRLRYHATGVTPAPIVVENEIDKKAGTAPWLGARRTQGELVAPDGKGRYAEFENGSVYWSPGTGAHPVPSNLLESWASYGWEAGALGYPVNDHTVLTGPDGQAWGDVQGFERGTLYRRYGQPGFYVHGEIGNRWFRSGFENGPLGWPVGLEVPFDTGSYQEFERGRIYWTPKQTLALVSSDGDDQPLIDKE